MANLLDSNEMFYQNYEPKVKFRFIMYIDGIPPMLIKQAARPQVESSEVILPHINVERYVKGKSKWNPIDITLLDPINPSGAQAVMEWFRMSHESVTGRDGYADFYQKDVTINILGPVGDIVEEWILKQAWLQSINFNELDWTAESDPVEISMTLRYNFAILNF